MMKNKNCNLSTVSETTATTRVCKVVAAMDVTPEEFLASRTAEGTSLGKLANTSMWSLKSWFLPKSRLDRMLSRQRQK